VHNIIAALILAIGLVVATWIQARGARYAMETAGVLLDRQTGTAFLPAQGRWVPLASFPGNPAK
jgi:hypothetical protein